jgi:polyferredoxin
VKNIRRFSQALFLLLFLWLLLQTESEGANELGYPVKIFLDADPLILITTLLASRSFVGRVFCGWICPLGTLHHLAGKLKKGTVPVKISGLYRIKHLPLIFILVLAFGGATPWPC